MNASKTQNAPLITPDGRYFVVRCRLWRCSNPSLTPEEKHRWTVALMHARRDKGAAMRAGDAHSRERAQQQANAAKIALGERGDPWWTDGAPDWNRYLVKNTPYAEWFSNMQLSSGKPL